MAEEIKIEQGKKFTIREIVGVIVFILGMAGTYYKVQFDVDDLKKDNLALNKEIHAIKLELRTYSGLPKEVEDMKEMMKDNAKMLLIIHDGLVAERIIAPRTN